MITQTLVNGLSQFVISTPPCKDSYIVYNEWAIKNSIRFENLTDVEWCLNFITDILKIKQNKFLKRELG